MDIKGIYYSEGVEDEIPCIQNSLELISCLRRYLIVGGCSYTQETEILQGNSVMANFLITCKMKRVLYGS